MEKTSLRFTSRCVFLLHDLFNIKRKIASQGKITRSVIFHCVRFRVAESFTINSIPSMESVALSTSHTTRTQRNLSVVYDHLFMSSAALPGSDYDPPVSFLLRHRNPCDWHRQCWDTSSIREPVSDLGHICCQNPVLSHTDGPSFSPLCCLPI